MRFGCRLSNQNESDIRNQLHQAQQALEMERHRAFCEKSELEVLVATLYMASLFICLQRDLRWALERMPPKNTDESHKNAGVPDLDMNLHLLTLPCCQRPSCCSIKWSQICAAIALG